MKFMMLLFFSQIFLPMAFAHSGHEGHGGQMQAGKPISGLSIFQLGSEWRNQKGEIVKLASLQGKPHLVVMLYTGCETACPLIVEDLKEVALDLNKGRTSPVDAWIFSLDSFRDTPQSLEAFAIKRKLPPTWSLFTGSADAVTELAAVLGVRYKRLSNGDFIHSNMIYFINGKGEIVAKKEGIKSPREDFIKKIKQSL